ncbi:hypothetical protein SBOR_10132 [Sclerotinia borealis F-4128]|uniref:Uncharacterized protein n=1 Tax=Sclerotinia borealis (strain F-4128) TaxID=1432307 RepID=W9C1A2_SCLBF|nr:hypothetical protein SBOR_10132 [Sclerotinia borealis F-4128]
MTHFNPNLDPSLFSNSSLNAGEIKEGIDANKDEGQILDRNKNNEALGSAGQAEGHSSEGEGSDMVDVDLGGNLGIDLMGNIGVQSDDLNMSASNRDGEQSEQEYSERVSEDDEFSISDFSDNDDTINVENKSNEVTGMNTFHSADSWKSDNAPPADEPPPPPSYSPPPTPILRLAPLFPPGVRMSSAASLTYFDNPIQHAIRINARKVRVHDTHVTIAEHRLKHLPGMWRLTSRFPSSLRRCWVPYDTFDEYLENTLVTVRDYGAEENIETMEEDDEDDEDDEDEVVID